VSSKVWGETRPLQVHSLLKLRANMRNVVVIGSGCAGLTAAIYTARANLSPLLIRGHEAGGQLSLTNLVENYPGFPKGVQGPELIEMMQKQAAEFGTEFQEGDVTRVDLMQRPFIVEMGSETIETRTLIIASGASARMLGLESERKLLGHGVSTCATCDGFFFRGKPIVVVGGGDTAAEESLFLTRFASEVSVIHRRDQLRASKIMQDRMRRNEKIKFIWNSTVTDVLDVDQGYVTGIKLKNVQTGEERLHPTEGVFIGIGHSPNTGLFRGQLEMDELGYLKTHQGSRTSVAGVFAAGDVQDRVYRQAITAAGSGCMAAIDAERFLENEGTGDRV
jgi:thioredoxin reductase (NADPH)